MFSIQLLFQGNPGVNLMYFKIDADVPDKKLEELIKLGPTYSPVYDTIMRAVPVTVELEK